MVNAAENAVIMNFLQHSIFPPPHHPMDFLGREFKKDYFMYLTHISMWICYDIPIEEV
jgi:hypothetical protein